MNLRSLVTMFIVSVTVAGGGLVAFAPSVQAVDIVKDACKGAPNSTVCKDSKNEGQNPLFGKKGILTAVVNILSVIASIAAIIIIIISGLKMVTSGTNPQEVNKAREGIIYALVGLIFVVIAQAVVRTFLSNL